MSEKENDRNIKHIAEAVRRGKLSHAYIINGAKDSGKEEFADRIAYTLLCDRAKSLSWQGDFKPCGTCPACIKTQTHNHPDIVYVRHEKETVLAVKEIRTQVVEDMAIKPYYGPYKIYIIKDAELMNDAAQNALLKTIEEPPEYGLIFLLTENADGFLNTIRSRCIRLNMDDSDRSRTVRYLMDETGEHVVEILKNLKNMDALEINNTAKDFEDMDKKQILSITRLWFRDVLVLKSADAQNRLFFSAQKDILNKEKNRLSYEGLNRILNAITEAESRLKASVKAEAVFENLLFAIRKEY